MPLSRLVLCGVSGTGVTAYALHPGVVQTDLWRHLNKVQQAAMWLAKPFTKTSVQGAQTTIYCAVAPELETESGKYYRSVDFHRNLSKRIVPKLQYVTHTLPKYSIHKVQ